MADSLGDRMKRYEGVYHHHALRRVPLVVRVDGRAFHTYARGFERPFSPTLRDLFLRAASTTAASLQGFVLAYHQSDEVSFVLLDTKRHESEPHFAYDIQKVVSTTASAFTRHFNAGGIPQRGAEFDARAFSVPADDIENYLLWRAQDWKRNSLEMLCRAHYSAKQLHGKPAPEQHELLYAKGVNWADLEPHWKNGTYLDRAGQMHTHVQASRGELELIWRHALALYMETDDAQLMREEMSDS